MNHGDHISRNRGAIRFLLLALGIPQALIGLWALLGPRSFYDGFPAGTDGWVNPLGPFAEHFVVDVGALFVGLGVLLTIAAIRLRRSLVTAAGVSWLIFSVPHAVWHAANLEPLATGDAVGNMVTLAWTVLGGLLVLWLARPPRTTAAGRPGAAGSDGGRADGGGDNGGARIAGVSDRDAGLLARVAFAASKREVGAVLEPTRVFAHHPTVLAGCGALEYATMRADRVPRELKALAATKAAALSGCEFCIDMGSSEAAKAGVPEAKLRALPDHRTSTELSDLERLVIDLAVGMTRTPVDVSDELFARLREHFDEAQLVELCSEIAVENYRARFNWAFGIGSQGFVGEGSYCVRAEPVPA